MISIYGVSLCLAMSSLGCDDHHARRTEIAVCSTFDPAIERDIVTLMESPRWRSRDDAAHRLAKVSWKRHPEILPALVTALVEDPEDEVREEAAESLKKLAPCVPEVHEALTLAARRDPDFCVRLQAKKALKALGKVCEGPCMACDPDLVLERRSPVVPMEPGLIESGPTIIEEGVPIPAEEIPPGAIVVPPSDLPAPLPDSTPFGDESTSSKKPEKKADTRVANRDRPKRLFGLFGSRGSQ